MSLHVNIYSICLHSSEQIQDADPVIKSRNYDPESRTIKKHSRNDDVEMQDTVEKAVEGLAHKIITEDEERRAQELVSKLNPIFMMDIIILILTDRMSLTLHRNERIGI